MKKVSKKSAAAAFDNDEEVIETKGKGKGASAGAKAEGKTKAAAVANPELVAALRNYENAKEEASNYLAEIASIYQRLELTRAEFVASLIEAKDISKATAESYFSRMSKLLKDPETLDKLKSGEITLREARAATSKPQKNPNAKRQQENREKRWNSAAEAICTLCKELGYTRQIAITSITASLKAAGIK